MLPRQRGSTLLIAMIMLAVLSVIGAAAVLLSSQERSNASTVAHLDALNACAQAAQAKLWAEVARNGTSVLQSALQVKTMTLPDGTKLAPAHVDQNVDSTSVSWKQIAITLIGASPSSEEDTGNKIISQGVGQTIRVYARCATPDLTNPGNTAPETWPHQVELEMGVRFAL